MAASRNQRFLYTAIGAAIIIFTSFFYHYTPIVKEKHVEYHWNKPQRMGITMVNNNSVGSGQWIELRCNALHDKKVVPSVSMVLLLQAGNTGVISVPEFKERDIYEVSCTYRGWNGCQANEVKLLENPGNDAYYCSESVRNCSFTFALNSGVTKRHEDRNVSFLGFLPTSENLCLSWFDCLVEPRRKIMGKSSCCGAKCKLW